MSKSIALLLIIFIPTIVRSQDVSGFFIHDWYHVDKNDLIKNRVTRIDIVTKGKQGWTDQIFLNRNGKKISQKDIRSDGTSHFLYDSTEIWYFAAPITSDNTLQFIRNDTMLIRKSPEKVITTKFNKSNQPVEELLIQSSLKVTRRFLYTLDNLLDTVFNVIERDNRIIGKDIYTYHYKLGKLLFIGHYLQLGKQLILNGVISYKYNNHGLIESYRGDFRDSYKLQVSVTYFSDDKKLK